MALKANFKHKHMSGISTTLVKRKTSKTNKNISISLNIRVKGFKPVRVATGIAIPEKNFTSGTVVGNGIKMAEYRKSLQKMIDAIESAYFDFIEQDKVPDPQLIIQYISNHQKDALTVLKLADMMVTQKKSELLAGNCTYHLVEKFQTIKDQLESFVTKELKKNDVFLGEVNFDFVTRFRFYLQNDLNNGNTTVNKKMSNLGQLFKYAVKNDWMKKDPTQDLKKLEESKTNHEFLTEEELKKVMKFELPNDTHEVIKDSFLFMAFTGMAFSDMAKFRFGDIKDSEGGQILSYTRKKTGVTIQLPVNDILAGLISKHYSKPHYVSRLKKYCDKTENDPVFSVPAMQVYNRKIKTLFEYNELYLGFEVSSHCARKSFGNMVNNHLGLSVASHLLGHSSISITEKNYVDNHNEDLGLSRGYMLNGHLSSIFNNS